ncbi:PKD domain-containing protein [Corallococcus terminator]|uniref:PKD domain-containing protein n=2 Tax=Corallococcus terminator TaxID=2316733 RepID=A0A3A8J7X8_9BACT|nr:PKD domain-containing protein [Corallococcus terminator]
MAWVLARNDSASPMPAPPRLVVTEPERQGEAAARPSLPARPLPAATEVPSAATGEALSAALNEERVVLASSAVIEGLDADRPWVCAGELLTLSARVGGTPEPGVVPRWVWPGQETGAELHPGARLAWRAPATAGRYFVRFQLCRDLGGRRVGVLAEQVAGIDVRACGAGEGQAHLLRIEVTQRDPTAFDLRAVSPAPATAYTWDFGDGSSTVTTVPEATHAFAPPAPGEQDVRVYPVRLTTGGPGGGQGATAFVQVRAQPPPEGVPSASLKLERVAARSANDGWRTQLQVDVPEDTHVVWERVERLTVSWDDQVETRTHGWRELITVEEDLGRGSFRGEVTVPAGDVRPEVKQVLDTLHGRDAMGREVSLSWASFKAEPQRPPPPPPQRPLPK